MKAILIFSILSILTGEVLASDILVRNNSSGQAFNPPRKCTVLTPCSDGSIGVPRNMLEVRSKPAYDRPYELSQVDDQIKQVVLGIVDKVSTHQGVDKHLITSVIKAESGFNPVAISPKGAMGVMQLIPATAKRFNVNDPYNPEDNIVGGVKYLKFLLERYQGNVMLAVAAYNAGESAVDRYQGVPPYPETQEYVKRVLSYYQNYTRDRGV